MGIGGKRGFRAFSSLFGQALPVMAPAILGLAGLLWLLGARGPEGLVTRLPGGRGTRRALAQVSGEDGAARRL